MLLNRGVIGGVLDRRRFLEETFIRGDVFGEGGGGGVLNTLQLYIYCVTDQGPNLRQSYLLYPDSHKTYVDPDGRYIIPKYSTPPHSLYPLAYVLVQYIPTNISKKLLKTHHFTQ